VTNDRDKSRQEVEYKVDGPNSQTFRIAFERHNSSAKVKAYFENLNPFKSTKEDRVLDLNYEGYGRASTIIVTGNEDIGYMTSLNPPIDWMHQQWPLIKNRKLGHVTIVGSHDAGMGSLVGNTPGSTDANTRTQNVDIYGQLVRGSRWFDIRPVIGMGGKWYAGHYSDCPTTGIGMGANGQSLQSMIDDINKFTEQYAELVIIELSHMCNTDQNFRPLNNDERKDLIKTLQRLNHRLVDHSLGSNVVLPWVKMSDLKPENEARVIVITDFDDYGNQDGIFQKNLNFPHTDKWSNTVEVSRLAKDQLQVLSENRKLVPGNRDNTFHLLSWTLTLDIRSTILSFPSIAQITIEKALDPLFWKAYNAFNEEMYPSGISMDYIGAATLDWETHTPQSGVSSAISKGASKPTDSDPHNVALLAMSVNMAIASRNKWVVSGGVD
jgi:hypothetical protein